jgi:acyl-CoA synthetase (AMP-forming)/AMP-acid ligase II
VWPDSVERVLRRHSGVAEVAVVGVPDAEWGQQVVAVVAEESGQPRPTLDALRTLAKTQLPAYAAPGKLVLVEALPRTTLGKVRRATLVEAIQRDVR